jgi:DNA-binding LytR/AlgR family response regulator
MELNKYNILIVEDEILIAQHIKMCIEKGNCHCVGIVKSFEDAMLFLKNQQEIDLILLDISLYGKKTGIELAEEINQNYKIPFVFLTSFSDPNTLDLIRKAKPLGYISKPINELDLLINLEIYCSNLKSKTNVFSFTIGNVKHNIDLSKLMYIKSNHIYIEMVFSDHNLLVRCPLKKMMALLPEKTLLQVNRSVAVNPLSIIAVNKKYVELTSVNLKISSLYEDNFKIN